MSEAKHTPGPWRVIFSEDNGAALRIEANGGDVPGGVGSVVRQNGVGMPGCDVGKANARLIAAAPALLEAVELALLFHSGSPWTPAKRDRWSELTDRDEATSKTLCDVLRAAVARATNQPAEDDQR